MNSETWKIHRAEIVPVPNSDGEIVGVSLIGVVQIADEVFHNHAIPVVDLDEAYDIKKWCDMNIEPYELEIYESSYEEYN